MQLENREIKTATVFKVLDVQSGRIEESKPEAQPTQLTEAMMPFPRDRRGRITVDPENVALTEAELATYNFPDALRVGLQVDLFSSYNETPVTYPQFVRVVNSDKQQEEYLFDAAIGLPGVVPEGQPYPEIGTNFDSGKIIRNYKRGFIIPVTEEMQRFDQVGKVREIPELLGRAMRRGEEQDVMNIITTAGNYTRNSTTGDNDEGANTAATTFSATGLITAFNTVRTAKDRTSGVYLNVMPDTLICGPKLWWGVNQLLNGAGVGRQGGNTTNEVYGTSTVNSFFNAVRTIIVSPEFSSSYAWWLGESKRAVTFQRVEAISMLTEGMGAQTEGYFNRDVIRYRVRNWYGCDMRDDRFAFFSSSSTAPVVA
jgi:hypothetical protein